MSFKVNSGQQISFNDSVFSLTAREKKALDNSWAKIFADEIFPNIDEERFSVLYSSKASRPNAPVNVIIGALIIKELFDYSDDEIVENLMLDLHLQYALHTTSFEEQPISDKTLSRFRSRCYNYETTHGIDLYHDCVKDLSSKIAKLMNLSGRIKRMDSMMIESNIRFLSRMELIYTCISKLAIYFDKNYPNKIPDDLKHYTDSNDYNRIFYHQLNDNMEQIIQALLSDSDKLLELCGTDYEEVTEYQLFLRCLSDQTVVENGKRRLRTKEDGTMNSTALQNPSDPDATYRNKAGKLHRGYVANLEETVDKNGSVVTDYQYDKNIHTDSQFLQESLSQMEIDHAVNSMVKGIASQAGMFVVFVTIDYLLNLVTLGGGFTALSNLLGGLAGDNASAVMLIASVVGGFGIEAAAVAEIKIISEMFGASAIATGLPMSMFAISILAATRLTGSMYPTTNLMGQLGIAHCDNTKEVLRANWFAVACVWAFLIVWAFLGVAILK